MSQVPNHAPPAVPIMAPLTAQPQPEQPTQYLPAVPTPAPQLPAEAECNPERIARKIWTGLRPGEKRDRRQLAMAMLAPMPNIKDRLNTRLEVVNAVCHPAGRVNAATGEYQEWVRTVLILRDGSMLDCGSAGIWQAIGILIGSEGPMPWANGVPVIPRAKDIGDGRQWYTLVPDFGPEPEPPAPRPAAQQSRRQG